MTRPNRPQSEPAPHALDHLKLLAEASRALAESSNNLDDALQTAAQLLTDNIGDMCVVRMLTADGRRLVPRGLRHRDPRRMENLLELVPTHAIPIGEGLNGEVLRTRQSVKRWFGTREEGSREVHPHYSKYVEQHGLGEIVVCPLISRDQVFGTLTVIREERSLRFSEQEYLLLQDLAGRVAVTIDNARLLEESAKAARQLRQLTDALPARFAYVDRELVYRSVNAEYERVWGKPRDKIVGHSVEQLLGPEAFKEALPFMHRVLAGEQVQYDLLTPLPVGPPRVTHVTYVPDRGPDGSVAGFFALVTDVTERKQTEEKLKQALRAREELMNICSHEFKTPLTGMSLQIEMARERLDQGDLSICNPPELRKILENSDKQIDRLIRLVNDMLDLTRISNGKMSLQLEPVNLAGLVYEVLDRFSGQIAAFGCEIDVNAAPGVIGHWDRYRIEQVIINLLTNSLRYGQRKPVMMRIDSSGGKAILSVRDQGIGIAPEDQERIFLRFERAISSCEVSGLGLGLFIAREIVAAHHGSIRVQSALGRGAEFIVELPIPADGPGVAKLASGGSSA